MDFGPVNALVREAANGAMALSALVLICVFSNYCWRYRLSLLQNKTSLTALAILILMVGHFIRASGAWTEFFLLRAHFDLTSWLTVSASWFFTAAVLIIAGKALMIYNFAPIVWRLKIILIGGPICLLVPLFVAFV